MVKQHTQPPSHPPPDIITKLFRKAEADTMNYYCLDHGTDGSERDDCPYGTANGSGARGNSYVNDDGSGKFWGSKDDRDDDGHEILMQELVQLILYNFDKLLYKYLTTDQIG